MSLVRLVAGIFVSLFFCSSRAIVVTLNPVADLRILSFAPNTNDNQSGLSTFRSLGNIQRSLVKFDLTSLARQQILTATLRLRGSSFGGSTAPTSVDTYRVLSSWSETQASWNLRDNSFSWINPGGDAVGKTGSQLTIPYSHWQGNGTSVPHWFEFDATDLVKDWIIYGRDNNGLMLVSEVGNELVFVSREGNNFASNFVGNPTEVPELVVQTVPERSGFLLYIAVIASCLLSRRSKTKPV